MFDDKHFNPFIGSGALGMTIDDFQGDGFDHSKLDFVGGAGISCSVTNGRPISNRPTAPGTPRWGAKWKQATKEGYQNAMGFGSQGSSYPVRENYLDLDPTYKDRHGRPLLRITFDFPDNDVAMSHYVSDQLEKMVKPFNAKYSGVGRLKKGWDSVPYQSTHNTGGAIMGLRSLHQRVEQVSAELGCAERLCGGRIRLCPQCRHEPDRHGGRARLLGGRCHHGQIHQGSWRAGAYMKSLILALRLALRTCLRSLIRLLGGRTDAAFTGS